MDGTAEKPVVAREGSRYPLPPSQQVRHRAFNRLGFPHECHREKAELGSRECHGGHGGAAKINTYREQQ